MTLGSPFHVEPQAIHVGIALRDAALRECRPGLRVELAPLLPIGVLLPVNGSGPLGLSPSGLPWTATYADHVFRIQLGSDVISTVLLCAVCWFPLPARPRTGRPRVTCSDGCRSALCAINAREGTNQDNAR